MVTHTLEVHYKVYDDGLGNCINVGPDPDGLGLVYIHTSGKDAEAFGVIDTRVSRPMALLLAEAIRRAAEDIPLEDA